MLNLKYHVNLSFDSYFLLTAWKMLSFWSCFSWRCFCCVSPLKAPVYLSSQSYMADSSLSEEMSQFDFSTGVQSFSFSSQNPEGRRRTLVKRVRQCAFTLLICLQNSSNAKLVKTAFCFDDEGIDRGGESLPRCDGGSRNGRAESARVHGSHDGAHWPHAQKRHHAQNWRGEQGSDRICPRQNPLGHAPSRSNSLIDI